MTEGNRHILDDFREAYYWLNQNTEPESKVLAWWDYGYQLAGMSNRTTIIDNNTWNFTHIGLVAKVFTADEQEASKICHNLDADYVLVTFGSYHGFRSDDYIKFLWFIRIAHDAYPEVNEWEYYKDRKFGLASDELSDKVANSLTFKLMYNRFGEIQLSNEYPAGYDYARDV